MELTELMLKHEDVRQGGGGATNSGATPSELFTDYSGASKGRERECFTSNVFDAPGTHVEDL